jgi:cystathionine beta-lyase/cystathionine gamma-synthase
VLAVVTGNGALVDLTLEDKKKKVNELVEELRIDKRDTSLGMCNTLCVLCILNVYDYHWVHAHIHDVTEAVL